MDFSAASLDHLGSAASLLLQRGQFKSSHPTDMQRSIFHRLNSSTSSCMRRTCHPRLLSPALAPRHPRLCAAQAAPDPDAVSSTAATDTAADNTTTSSSGQQQQHCRVRFRGTAFDVPQGTKLRTALLRNGVSPHNGKASIINVRSIRRVPAGMLLCLACDKRCHVACSCVWPGLPNQATLLPLACCVTTVQGPRHVRNLRSGNQVNSIAWVCFPTLAQLSAGTHVSMRHYVT